MSDEEKLYKIIKESYRKDDEPLDMKRFLQLSEKLNRLELESKEDQNFQTRPHDF